MDEDGIVRLGRRAPDRRSSADLRHRDSGRAADRPALASPPDDRFRPRSLRSLRRAAVHDQRAPDHRARGGRRHRHRVLPSGGLRRAAERRPGRRPAECELAAADRGQPDLGSRLSRRRPAGRGLRCRRRLLDQRVHVPDLRGLPLGNSPAAAAGHSGSEPRPLARLEGRLQPHRPLARAPDRAHRLERGHVFERRSERRGAPACLPRLRCRDVRARA